MSQTENDETSLADIVDFFLKYWVALAVLPAAAAIAAFLLVSTQPRSYQASATLSPPSEGADITFSLYIGALSKNYPADVTLVKGNAELSARSALRQSAEDAVKETTTKLIAPVESALEEERSRIDRQRQYLDRIWQSVGDSPVEILSASSLEGELTGRSDRLARVERWLVSAKTAPVQVSGPTPNSLTYAVGALLGTFVLAMFVCLVVRNRNERSPGVSWQ